MQTVIVADDDAVNLRLVGSLVSTWDYYPILCSNADQALKEARSTHGPLIFVLDWNMPGTDGMELAKTLKKLNPAHYILMLSSRVSNADLTRALEDGADDYLRKPFEPTELRARVLAGHRTIQLNVRLQQKIAELEETLARVQQLESLLPICMHCKKIRDPEQRWTSVEHYISARTQSRFTHGICPECLERMRTEL
ncbi:MAG TPA: response regulator [Methylomirabilota bacterium]|nr:response regulator [Methylomirabilota bacterium]